MLKTRIFFQHKPSNQNNSRHRPKNGLFGPEIKTAPKIFALKSQMIYQGKLPSGILWFGNTAICLVLPTKPIDATNCAH